jgi:2,4-dienoyl-CoA reductase-like NADH-dependent reductase (Old Yellow Enzyme family)
MAAAGVRAGGHIWMQISHAGRQMQALLNPHPKAPSAPALGLSGGQFAAPSPLTEPESLELVEDLNAGPWPRLPPLPLRPESP